MSTSLKEQLQRLKVPQTSGLIDKNRRASIIFDAKEAATKDRRQIYELGANGLQELIAFDSDFKQFSSTLFDEATINLVRSIEQSEVNTILDKNIAKFLQHLSPYFLLRPAHLCIEWLLRRFEVHIYNRNELLALALPYHETNIFVRVLQVVQIKEGIDDGGGGDWNWLRPLQTPGLTLPKSLIINRAASNAGFFNFVTTTTLNILREFGSRAHLLQTQINFYTTVVVGALETLTTDTVKEWHITNLLPSLLHALNSKILDVAAAGYIITSQLVSRTQLKSKLCNYLLDKVIAAVSFEELRPSAVMLMLLIFDKQEKAPNSFSQKALNVILGQKWLIPILAALVKENIDIFPLYYRLLRDSVKEIQSDGHDDKESFIRLAQQLMEDIDLPKNTAISVISCFLDCYVYETPPPAKLQDEDIIDLDSDEEMPSADTAFAAWYSKYLHKLDQKYPDAFDIAIKEALSSGEENESLNRKMALKIAIGYRLKMSNENAMNIYESLYHHNPQIRQLAIKTLLQNLSNYQTRFQNMELLKACLADRLLDDSRLVVGELLKLPEKDFIEILGCEKYAEGLLALFEKTQTFGADWSKLTPTVVKHLTSTTLLNGYDSNIIFLALMPVLYPSDRSKSWIAGVNEILQSDLVKKFPSLKKLQPTTSSTAAARAREHFMNIFDEEGSSSSVSVVGLPKAKELFKSAERQGTKLFKRASNVSYFMLYLCVSINEPQTAMESLEMYEFVEKLTKNFRIKLQDNLDKAQLENFIPLRLNTMFLLALARFTKFEQLPNWNTSITSAADRHIELNCFFRFFIFISNNILSSCTKPEEKTLWTHTMMEFFDLIFPNIQSKVDFLTNFYVKTDVTDISHCCAAERLLAFKVLNSILHRGGDSHHACNINLIHILKIANALTSQHATIRAVALETLEIIRNKCDLNDNLKFLLDGILSRTYEIKMDREQYSLALFLLLTSTTTTMTTTTTTRRSAAEESNSKMIFRQILELYSAVSDAGGRDITFLAQLLDVLKHFNDEKTIESIIPLAIEAIEKSLASQTDERLAMLSDPYDKILLSVIQRFQTQNIENILRKCPSAWSFFEKIFEKYDVFVTVKDCEMLPLPCVLLSIYEERLFESLSANHQFEFIKLILRTMALAQNDTIAIAAYKMLKHCVIDCKPLEALLQHMYTPTKDSLQSNAKIANRKSKPSAPIAASKIRSQFDANRCLKWKEGVALLELLEKKEKLLNSEQLIPPLFELLKYCLDDLDDEINVEYTKQLILSSLLHCCRSAQAENIKLEQLFSKTIFRIDRIVQCVRATQNPQTHQSALTLLALCARIFPQQVLHNVVDIFTFMGSSVVRQDDAFSFHIIDNIIVSIIPILIEADADKNRSAPVIPVLKVFSDIMLDVPEHRRISLYSNLLNTLGATNHFWRFLCIVFEAQVADEEKRRLLMRKTVPERSATATNSSAINENADKQTKRLEFIMQLSDAFEPEVIVETCTQILLYLKNGLPLSKEMESQSGQSGGDVEMKSKSRKSSCINAANKADAELFDVGSHSDKQLRHFKYSIMQYVSTVSKTPELLRKIARFDESDLMRMKPHFQNFIISILSYIPSVNEALERFDDEPLQLKFWKVILHHLHDALDNAISLLSPDMFLMVIIGLMQHQMLSIRKKVIELLITKMQSQDVDDLNLLISCGETRFHELLKPLNEIIDTILTKQHENEGMNPESPCPPSSSSASSSSSPSSSSNEWIFLQQTTLISLKLLSKHFALKYIPEFKVLLGNLTKIVKCRANTPKIITATVVLTLIEISSNLKAHSLEQLPRFMPQLIELLQQHAEAVLQQPPDHVCIAVLTGVQKLFESLPRFLGPYMVDIIAALSSISRRIENQKNKKDQRSSAALAKISAIRSKMVSEIYVRILVPSCEKSYDSLMEAQCYDEVEDVMILLRDCIKHASDEDLAQVKAELRTFFMNTLSFRYKMKKEKKLGLEQCRRVSHIESSIIDAFVAYVLKLSESSFRPLYESIYDMTMKVIAEPETQLTYFQLSSRIGDALKSLFLIFAGTFLEDAAKLLDACNTSKSSSTTTTENDDEAIRIEMLSAILRTLHNVFLYASKNFMSIHRFEMLMPKLVDQLENRLTHENDAVQRLLTDCISQLAVAVSNDVMWKQLNYQVLLKTRINIPEVRILSFNCCVEIARKLGDEFTSLLPETVPFIAELFEDENSRVEKNTRKSVQELEAILGESLQKYL